VPLLLQVLLDQLAKRPTRQVAALVGRYHQLGLAASRVMKKAAAEFARRPEQEADSHMLLEVLEGLAGFGDVKVLPPQLLTRWVWQGGMGGYFPVLLGGKSWGSSRTHQHSC
jgi:hypothetical protein